MLNDKRAILQVLGCLMQAPTLLDDHSLETSDFEGEKFHELIFSCIYNLYSQGVNRIDSFSIDSYLSRYEKQYKIFEDNNGVEYCENAQELADLSNFLYYYDRLRKFSYLRELGAKGFDTRLIYDDTITDPELQEEEMRRLDALTIADISEYVMSTMLEASSKFLNGADTRGQLAGKGMRNLKEDLKKEPEIGIPTQSKLFNTIVRGARLKKFYLRSGNTGSGKTRTGVGDICTYSVPWYYDTDEKKWIHTGFSCPAAFISTELDEQEMQTLIMAFVSGVNEEHICDGRYIGGDADEEARVDKAIEYIESSPLYIVVMEDFDLDDIERIIRHYKREFGVQYFAFDYIQNTVKMMTNINTKTRGRLQEHQLLLIMSAQIKMLCNRLNVHIDSFTQVNGEYANVKEKNQNIIAGGKAIANKIDVGVIALAPSKIELETVKKKVLSHKINCPEPNLIYHVYKVRRGKLSRIMLWLKADLGTCRTKDLFVTDLDFNEIPIELITIENIDKVIEETSIDVADVEATEEEQQEAIASWGNW